MEQIDIIDVLRRRMRMIIALCAVSMLVAFFGAYLLPKRYTSVAYLLVRPQQEIKLDTRSTTKEFLDFPIGQAAVETPSKTFIEIVKSPSFIGQLVRKLELDAPEESKPGFASRYLPAFMKPVIDGLKQSIKNTISILMYGSVLPEDRFADAVRTVQKDVALETRPDTYIFTITYTANEPEKAAKVANGIAKLFVEYMDDLHFSEGKYVRDRLLAKLEADGQALEEARQRVQVFKEVNKTFRFGSEHDISLKVIGELQTELARLDESLAGLEAVANDKSLSAVTLAAKRKSISETLKELKAALEALPEMEREMKQLDLKEKIAVSAVEMVERVNKEWEIKTSNAAREIQLVSQAVPAQLPGGPTRPILVLATLLGALVVGVGLAFLLEYQNQSLRGIRDVEDHVGLKVIATIPRTSQPDKAA